MTDAALTRAPRPAPFAQHLMTPRGFFLFLSAVTLAPAPPIATAALAPKPSALALPTTTVEVPLMLSARMPSERWSPTAPTPVVATDARLTEMSPSAVCA